MSELVKTLGQLAVNNLSLAAIIVIVVVLTVFKGLFKIAKKEVDPLRWFTGKVRNALTKDVRKDISDFKVETHDKFEEIKHDRKSQVDVLRADNEKAVAALRKDVISMKQDTNEKILALRQDLDVFEERTNSSIDEMKVGTTLNCETLKKRLDDMQAAQQKSNDMQTVQTIRAHILDFANSCYNKRKHTKQEFMNIMEENKLYKKLVEKYDIENEVYKEDYDFIMKCYHKCQEEGSFLKEGD